MAAPFRRRLGTELGAVANCADAKNRKPIPEESMGDSLGESLGESPGESLGESLIPPTQGGTQSGRIKSIARFLFF